jgi:hypothetical protein
MKTLQGNLRPDTCDLWDKRASHRPITLTQNAGGHPRLARRLKMARRLSEGRWPLGRPFKSYRLSETRLMTDGPTVNRGFHEMLMTGKQVFRAAKLFCL